MDLFHFLLLQRSALATAMIAPVPWVGTGLASYVHENDGQTLGFVQLLRRHGRQEADVLFIAPGVGKHPQWQTTWGQMLAHCIQDARNHDLRRLFASPPEGGAEVEALNGLGFMVYSNEDVYSLHRPPRDLPAPADARLRPRGQEDVWWLRRLNSIYMPQPVQHAEGLADSGDSDALSLAWWELTDQQGFVLVEGGDIRGGVQIVSGRSGQWLLLHGDPSDTQQNATLIRQGLHAAHRRKPVYCAVRDYQGGLRAVLQDAGFGHVSRRSRLVKHVALPVRFAEPVTMTGMIAERPG